MLRTGLAAFLAFVVVVGSTAPTARAQPVQAPGASEGELAEARRLFFEGVDAEDGGRYEDAVTLYVRASRIAVSPTLLFNIATCHERLGRLLQAEAVFERALDEARTHKDAEVESEALAKLASLKDEIPRIVLRLAPGTEGAVATLDESPLATLGPERLNPGSHRLAVRSASHARTFEIVLSMEPRSERVVDVDLGPVTGGDAATRAARRTYVPMLVAAGSALVLGGGAIVTGLVGHTTYERYLDLNATPAPENRSEREDLRKDGQTLYVANTVLLGATVVAAAVAVYFLVRPPASAAPPLPPRRASRAAPHAFGAW
jgi:hypothetical protein